MDSIAVGARAPELKGVALIAYRAVWALLLAFVVLVTVAGAALTNRYYDHVFEPFVSLGLRWSNTRTTSMQVPITREGDLAKLRRGDVILTVDGRPVPSTYKRMTELTGALKAAPGPSVHLRVKGRDGSVRDLAVARTIDPSLPGASLMSGRQLLLTQHTIGVVSAIFAIAAAALLFMRRPRDRAAGLMSIVMLLLGLKSALINPVISFIPALHPVLVVMGTTVLMLAINLALLIFPGGRIEGRFARGLAAIVVVYAAVVTPGILGLGEILAVGQIPNVIVALSLLTVFLRYRGLPPGVHRQQIRWAFFGFACSLALVIAGGEMNRIAYASITLRWSTVMIAASSVLFALAVMSSAGGLLVSLLRYRLYDADQVISRSATFAVVTLVLAAGWAGAEKVIEVLMEEVMGHDAGAASAGIAAAVAALLITPVHHRVQHTIEHVFQRKLADLRHRLPDVVGDLRETAMLSEVVDYVLPQLTDAVRARRGAIVLRTPDGLRVAGLHDASPEDAAEWLKTFEAGGFAEQDRDDLVFPLRQPLVIDGAGRTDVGWIALGPRPDGSFYGKDERDAVREAAGPIARALHIIQRREAREARVLAEVQSLSAAVAKLVRGPRAKPA